MTRKAEGHTWGKETAEGLTVVLDEIDSKLQRGQTNDDNKFPAVFTRTNN